ncbi:MAG: C25 family cysteine peptidase [Candidatus Kapabacteria bacterium]|nr:C25 family cysteine peptidase [Candidatus Kapabacteria bacterium]MDW8012098.1 C25 family cysteine peptidase [Bacteroidota bacterium]
MRVKQVLMACVSSVALLSAAVQRQLSPAGIELELHLPRAEIRQLSTGRYGAFLAERGAFFIPDSAAPACECLQFWLAIPRLGQLPDVEVTVVHQRHWENVALATVGEALLGSAAAEARSAEAGVALRYAGIWRGIPVAVLRVCPWRYDADRRRLSLWAALRLRIRYPEPMKVLASIGSWAPGEWEWARQLLNPEHALGFRSTEGLHGGTEPFRFERPIVKLTTLSDGIAVVPLRRVLEVMPEWRGTSTSRLELLWRGMATPCLLLDRDGSLDDSDTLLFFGRRPAGDTTWLDAYTAEEPFFLVLRDSGSGLRFLPLQADGSPLAEADILPTRFWRESDRVYVSGANVGFFRNWTETAPGEGWYWSTMRAGGKWRDSLQLVATDSISVRLIGYALNSLSTCAPEHRLMVFLNGDTVGAVQRSGWGGMDGQWKLPPSRWSAGWNVVAVSSLPADTVAVCSVAEQGIDAWELILRPGPVAYGGQWHGRVTTSDSAARLVLHGFRTRRAMAIDTLRWRAALLEGTPERVVRVAARSGRQPLTELFIGDSLVVRREERGTLLLWWQPPQYEQQLRWIQGDAASLQRLLVQLPSGTFVVGAVTESLPTAVTELLRTWGLQQGEQTRGGQAWVWVLRRGDTLPLYERAAAEGEWANLFWSFPQGSGQYRVEISLSRRDTAVLWVADERRWQPIGVERLQPPSLLAAEPQADAIIIAPPQLLAAARQWAQMRQQTHGIRSRIVTTVEISSAFGFGRLTPHAIKAFLRYAYERWRSPAPQFVLLFGSASWDARNLLGHRKPNLVPAYGVPPSDYWYTLLQGDDYLPELFIGRIPAADSAEAAVVLGKLAAWEDAAAELWRKRALLIFGYGFNNTMETYYQWLTDWLGMEPTVVQKETPEPSSSRYGPQIRQVLQEGVGLTIYFGHGAEANMEVQGWEPQRLTNVEHYSILMTLSCSMGNFAVPYVRAYNEQYVTVPGGMVAAMGMAGIGWDIVEKTVQHHFFRALVEEGIRLLGVAYTAARLPLAGFVAQDVYRATVLQHTLLGDPLLRFPVDTVPEFFIASGPFIHRGDGRPLGEALRGDSLWVRVAVGNLGIVPSRQWRLRLVHRSPQGWDSVWIGVSPVRRQTTVDIPLPSEWQSAGRHQLWVQLNPDSLVPERTWQNNEAVLEYVLREPLLVPLEPLPFWHVTAGRVRFRVLNPSGRAADSRYEAELWSGGERIEAATEEQLLLRDECVDWQPAAVLQPGRRYLFRIRAVRRGDTLWTQWLEVPFWTDTLPTFRAVQWRQSDSADWSAGVLQNMEVVSANGQSVVQLRRWRRQVEAISDPVRTRAVLRLDGRTVMELEQEAGIGVVVFSLGDTVAQVRFYRTGRTGQEEDAQHFLSLLRDSLRPGQMVAWALSGDGLWRWTPARLDSLRQVLRSRYGSRLADSLQRTGIAFVFVGDRGGRSPFEAFRRGDSVMLSAVVERRASEGYVLTPWIGPARRWEQVQSYLSPASAWFLTIYGRREAEEREPDILYTGPADTAIDLRSEPYSYIQLKLEARAVDSVTPTLRELSVAFEPQGEVGVTQASLVPGTALLGDTLPVRLRVWNRALRAEAASLRFRFTVWPNTGQGEYTVTHSAILPPDTALEFTVRLPTVGWYAEGNLRATVAAAGELYSFNNTAEASYRLGLDTIPPQLTLWWQDGEVFIPLDSATAVSRQPTLWLVIHDNDRTKPLTRAQLPRLWIEGRQVDSLTAQEYRFFTTAEVDSLPVRLRGPTVRAALHFVPWRLPVGRVFVWGIAEDAAGLRDTLAIELRVVDRPALRFVRQYPQPTGRDVTVQFLYEGPQGQGVVVAEVFSAVGELVYAAELPVVVGQNEWKWAGNTVQAARVAPGVYLWRLWPQHMGPSVGISGVCVVVP